MMGPCRYRPSGGPADAVVDPLSTPGGEPRLQPGNVLLSSWLAAVDRGFVALTVVYLSFVALLPFPTGVLGEFADNPISVVAFAVNMGAVSTMEAVLFSHARRRRLFREE
jgi:hypothetical protein